MNSEETTRLLLWFRSNEYLLKACIFGGNCILIYSDAPRGNLKNNHWDPIHHRTDRWGQDPRTCDVLWIRLTSATGNATSKTKWMESLFGERCVFWFRCVHPMFWLCTPSRSIDNPWKYIWYCPLFSVRFVCITSNQIANGRYNISMNLGWMAATSGDDTLQQEFETSTQMISIHFSHCTGTSCSYQWSGLWLFILKPKQLLEVTFGWSEESCW